MRSLQLGALSLVVALAIATVSCGGSGGNLEVESETASAIPSPDSFIPVDTPPKPEKLVSPKYPRAAAKKGIEGEVFVKAFVDAEGDVLRAFILKDSGKDVGFEDAALKAARKGKWKPAVSVEGEPIGVWVAYPIKFTLNKEEK